MSVPLPSLDDRTYADLVGEARSLIPRLYPAWTNHNPADPGIALVELLAWLTEQIIYRADQVPAANYWAFLELLQPGRWRGRRPELDEAVRATLLALQEPYRAASAADYEQLALGWPGSRGATVWQARCLAQLRPRERGQKFPLEDAEGHITLVVVPKLADEQPQPRPNDAFCEELEAWLDERRLLGTRNSVVGPDYLSITVSASITLRADYAPPQLLRANRLSSGNAAIAAAVRFELEQALERHYHPITGGDDGRGWPLGSGVYTSALYELLRRQPGVARVTDVSLDAEEKDNILADGEGVWLNAYQLPSLQVTAQGFSVSIAGQEKRTP